MSKNNIWDIIYCFYDKPIHIEHLKKSNKHNNIILANITNTHKPLYAWANCDKLVRNWLIRNHWRLQSNNIAIFEWDVLVTKQLPDLEIDGLYCKEIQNIKKEWYWFKHIKKLGKYRSHAIGCTPFGVLFMNKQCVLSWIDNKFDCLYNKNIFCELRFPTIINYSNIPIYQFDFPNVFFEHTKFNHIKNDIYHPVKFSYNDTNIL